MATISEICISIFYGITLLIYWYLDFQQYSPVVCGSMSSGHWDIGYWHYWQWQLLCSPHISLYCLYYHYSSGQVVSYSISPPHSGYIINTTIISTLDHCFVAYHNLLWNIANILHMDMDSKNVFMMENKSSSSLNQVFSWTNIKGWLNVESWYSGHWKCWSV